MKGKGLVKFFAVVLTIICLVELFPTFYTNRIESKADKLSNGTEASKRAKLEGLAKDTLNLGFVKVDYYTAKRKEVKLGLDLKGGLNLLLEISERDLLYDLADNSNNKVFLAALDKASEDERKGTTQNYTDNFFKYFKEIKNSTGENSLMLSSPDIFGTKTLSSKIQFNSTDEQVQKYIKGVIESRVNAAIDVIRARIKKLDIEEPNIARVPGTGRILVELPGVTDADRVKKLLQTSARLEFWECQNPNSVGAYFSILDGQNDKKFLPLLKSTGSNSNAIATVKVNDTLQVNQILRNPISKGALSIDLKHTKFLWENKATNGYINLYAIKGSANGKAPLVGAVTEASVTFDQFNRIQISMQMDGSSSLIWKDLTEKNIGHPIAVVLDGVVYTAPNVNTVIPNGQSVISGNYTEQEASDLVDVLKSGKLPARANIIQSEVVGPTLGQQSINNGVISIIISYIFILIWMVFYYGRAGISANIAVVINLFFTIGIMISRGIVFTLPGIAGIVLTMAMAIDANIIIFERVKEELRMGKSLKAAYIEGQKHGIGAIVDGHITTLIVGIVLYFSTGPIKGFAIALIIGVFCTLFTSIFIAALFIHREIDKGVNLKFCTNITKNWFKGIKIKWIERRKTAYIVSGIIIIGSLASIFYHGFDKGVDYTGGRTFVIKLSKEAQSEKISSNLGSLFIENGVHTHVDVKQFGGKNQIRLTTKYGIEKSNDVALDNEIRQKLFDGLKLYLPTDYTKEKFVVGEPYGIQSASEVGPSVAEGIVKNGIICVSIALICIFIYILIRFRDWQMSAGAVLALLHDAVVVLGAFSLLSMVKVVPFSVELDQSFIASILTIIGFSINDTVIVFDRIREHKRLNTHHSMSLIELYDDAINHTLGRTINTALSAVIVVLIIFLFGGESLEGFMFALLLGFIFGIYSSIYIASAISYDLTKNTYDSVKKIKS